MSSMANRPIRNIAIIAHVDHGKTTLVDCLLRQSGTFAAHEKIAERVMDSNDIEKERGITILAKNCAIEYGGTRINIVDTPGHADFGGEVERVLSMVDTVLLVVDAVEGPMPQTRFVTRKALALGLNAIVVVNKIDRPGARPDWVIDQTFELFDKLGATDRQLDFPVIYASALEGWASTDHTRREPDMRALYEAILHHVPAPKSEPDAPLQFQISTLDYNSYVGRIGIGRIRRGTIKAGQTIQLWNGSEDHGTAKVQQVLTFKGLTRESVESAVAGDIVAVTGIEDVHIGYTICDVDQPDALPPIAVDEPTLVMNFQVNTSPLAGKEGKFVTSRQIRERLMRELESNVALRVEETADADVFRVSGRGELHLTILIENMRREGYELAVGKPRVLTKTVERRGARALRGADRRHRRRPPGRRHGIAGPPQGRAQGHGERRPRPRAHRVPRVGARAHRLPERVHERDARHRPAEPHLRRLRTARRRHSRSPQRRADQQRTRRRRGVFAVLLQERGRMFVSHGEAVYEGMIIGIHSRENDLVVNPIKTKKLTNIRAAGKDDALILTPPIELTLEYAVEFIADDELVEVTPKSIRIRKRLLQEHERKRASRVEEALLA